jgi:acetoin:2,6-dichlorophenolindophenol oxidoreductase subunit alpha
MGITREQKIQLYINMVRVRKVDELMVKAFFDKKLAGPYFHSQQGQEAIGAGAATFLRPDDYVFHSHRGHGLCEVIAKGLPVKKFVAEHFGKVTGSCRGVGFLNSCDLTLGLFGMGGTVGGEFTVGTGVGLAARLRGKGQVVTIFFGDGATGRGSLHEGMLMSANWKLPVIWLCSNNGMGMWVPVKVTFPKENIADLAFGYGIPASIVDGQDVLAVYEAVRGAVTRAREGEGPSFIEFKTCRFRPQLEGVPDICQEGLRSEEELNAWKERDPIKLMQEKLLKENTLTPAEVEKIDREATEEAAEAERLALASPAPSKEILAGLLYAD